MTEHVFTNSILTSIQEVDGEMGKSEGEKKADGLSKNLA
jgi:hypothetical protein